MAYIAAPDYSTAPAKQERELLTRPLSIEDVPPTMPAQKQGQYERHIVLSDYHHRTYAAYDPIKGGQVVKHAHDPQALAAAEAFMAEWQPTHIHYAGDWFDFHAPSKFCKTAPDPDEIDDSIHAVRSIMWRHRTAYPNAHLYYELGNHDERWHKYLETQAPALAHLKQFTYEALLGARELRLTISAWKELVPIIPGVLVVTHGDRVANKSGATANKMLEMGVSGVSGHVHRLGTSYRTTYTGTAVWAENGCLCSLEPDWMANPNWQQGFTLVYSDPVEQRFWIEQVPIIKGRAFHAGRLYGQPKRGGG